MNKYEHSKIYKIVNDVNDMIYVGSTTEPLDKRWLTHLIDYKRRPNNKLYKKIHKIGIEHFKIILISIYPCKSKEQLIQRERVEYDKYDSSILLNTYRPTITKEEEIAYRKKRCKEYYEVHKEELNNKNQKYYVENRDIIRERNREYSKKHRDSNIKRCEDWRKINKEQYSNYRKNTYHKTKVLRNYLPFYNVTQKETHLYF